MRQLKTFEAYLDNFNTIAIYLSKQSYDGVSRIFYLENEKGELEELTIQTVESTSRNYNKYTCKTKNEIELGKNYNIYHEFARRTVLKMGYIVKTSEFDKKFAYTGNDLGVTYSKEKTTFKLWAPTAVFVNLSIADNSYHMKRTDKGVYEITLRGDYENMKYHYYILVDGEWRSSIDPYGKSSLSNSKHSVVIDVDKIKSDKIIIGESIFNGYIYIENDKIVEVSKVDKPSQEFYDYTGKYNL